MNKFFSMLFLLVMSISIYAQQAWTQDPAHSRVAFTVIHNGISDITGVFQKFDLKLSSIQPDLSDAKINFTVDVNSIDTAVEARDNHLKSADFFNVEKYPTISFHSTSVKKLKENTYELKGNLNMNDITKPAKMTMVYRGDLQNKDGSVTKGLQVYGDINRADWNIGPKFPKNIISEIVRIKGDFEIHQ